MKKKKYFMNKGIAKVALGDQRELRHRLMKALNCKYGALQYRIANGVSRLTVDEKALIESVFAKFDIKPEDIWEVKSGGRAN